MNLLRRIITAIQTPKKITASVVLYPNGVILIQEPNNPNALGSRLTIAPPLATTTGAWRSWPRESLRRANDWVTQQGYELQGGPWSSFGADGTVGRNAFRRLSRAEAATHDLLVWVRGLDPTTPPPSLVHQHPHLHAVEAPPQRRATLN